MSKFVIPKRFRLFGKLIEVELVSTLVCDRDAVGSGSFRKNEIIIQDKCDGYDTTDENIEQNFLHEVVHFILHALHYENLDENEQLIDLIASSLHQILTTMEYD